MMIIIIIRGAMRVLAVKRERERRFIMQTATDVNTSVPESDDGP